MNGLCNFYLLSVYKKLLAKLHSPPEILSITFSLYVVPAKFVAEQTNQPSSSLSVCVTINDGDPRSPPINRSLTPETNTNSPLLFRNQATERGDGLPVTSQFSVTLSPIITEYDVDSTLTVGGSVKMKNTWNK